MFLNSLENHKQVIEQGRRGRGAKGAMAPPIRAKSVDFSEIFTIFPLSLKFLSIGFPFRKCFVFGPP